MEIDKDDLITQQEAARIRRVSQQSINDLVRRGRLTVTIIGGRKFVSKSEVKKFKPAPAGRPKGSKSKKKQTRRKSK